MPQKPTGDNNFDKVDFRTENWQGVIGENEVFDFLSDLSQDGIAIYHYDDGVPVYVNARFLEILNLSRGNFEKMGMYDPEIFHPEENKKPKWRKQKLLDLKDKATFRAEYRLLDNFGLSRHAMLVEKVFKTTSHHTPLLIIGVLRDITEKKLTELHLVESQRMLNDLLNTSPGVIYVYDFVENEFTFGGEKLRRMSHYPDQHFSQGITKGIMKLIHRDDLIQFNNTNRIIQNCVDDSIFFNEFRVIRGSNDFMWLGDNSKVFERTNTGKVKSKIGLLYDITEPKSVQNQLKKTLELKDDLIEELKVEKKKLALSQVEISETNKFLTKRNTELARVNSELDYFVYSVSHDLRSPITSLLGLINLTKTTQDQSEIDLYLTLQEKSIKKLDSFTKDILNYLRNDRTEIEHVSVDLALIINEVIEQNHYLDNFDKIDFRITINDDVSFLSDSKRISIIFNNLISNAIRYSDPSKEKSFVDIRIQVSESEAVVIVEDNGIGIGEEHHKKVYDIFYRATDRNSGSGFGLYIIKQALEKLIGSITFETQLKKGTKFILHIPNNL